MSDVHKTTEAVSSQPDLFHSPGQWRFDGPPNNHIVWSGPEQRVCFLTSDGPTTANARLIAAAPALLEAAKLAKASLIHDLVEPGRTAFWALVEAINKAEGK